jgi:hypothetical protein
MAMRAIRTASLAIAALASHVTSAAAQFTGREWYYSITPYFWASGLDGKVGAQHVSADVNMSFGDVWDALKFGGTLYGEARVRRYVLGLDANYVSIGGARTIAFRGDTGVLSLDQKQTMIQPTVGTTVGGDWWALDFVAGLRYWQISTDLDVDRALRPPNDRKGSRSWVDATGGARLQWIPYDAFRVILGADGGGGGSNGTWQGYVSLGADVSSWCALSVGYRGLLVNYDRDGFLYDVHMRGLTLAATLHMQRH